MLSNFVQKVKNSKKQKKTLITFKIPCFGMSNIFLFIIGAAGVMSKQQSKSACSNKDFVFELFKLFTPLNQKNKQWFKENKRGYCRNWIFLKNVFFGNSVSQAV